MAYRILSLDGGGTWALLQAFALKSIFPGRRGHEILAQFDMAVANSGGSIVLGGLTLDKTPEEIQHLFEDETLRRGIFHKKNFLEEALTALPIFPRYDAAQKKVGLGHAFGPAGDQLLSTLACPGRGGAPIKIMITTFDYETVHAKFLRGYDMPNLGSIADAVSVINAVHASSNAPVTFFDAPAVVGTHHYWDGAMGGYNNPVMAAVVDAMAMGLNASTFEILSLGTGTTRRIPASMAGENTASDLIDDSRQGIVTDAGKAAGCITDDPPDAATFTAHVVTGNRANAIGRLVRLSPLVQPVSNGNGWNYPPGLDNALFRPLTKLSMDAVDNADVDLIQKLATAWIQGNFPNQPIHSHANLTAEFGDATFAAGAARWQAMVAAEA